MKTMLEVLGALLFVAFLVVAGYFSWRWERKMNYDGGYTDMVDKQIRATVKPECLK